MRSQHWFRSALTTRLLAVALVPSLLLFAAMLFALFKLTRLDAESDVRERGRLAAVAIAQSIQYDVVSGNAEGLRHALARFRNSDPTLARITVLNQDRIALAEVGSLQGVDVLERIDAPITREVPTLSLFDKAPGNPLGGDADAQRPTVQTDRKALPLTLLGSVQISVHAAPLLQVRMKRAVVALLSVSLVGIGCLGIGLALAQRVRRPFAQVMASLRDIREGRFKEAALVVSSPGEMGELEKIVNGIAESMNRSHHQLETEVENRTERLRTLQAALYDSNQERGAVLARTNRLIEDERRKLSHEIHDRFNADLVAVKHAVGRISEVLVKQAVWLDSTKTRYALIADLEQIQQNISGLYTTARGIVKSLRPEVLDTLGLEQALQELLGQFERDQPQCSCTLTTAPKLLDIEGNMAITAYRVVQECLTNIVKHAQATHVSIEVTRSPENRGITICVRDDGVGFVVGAPRAKASLGLIAIRERAEGVRGRVRVTSSEIGTEVCLDLPTTSLS